MRLTILSVAALPLIVASIPADAQNRKSQTSTAAIEARHKCFSKRKRRFQPIRIMQTSRKASDFLFIWPARDAWAFVRNISSVTL